VFNAYMTTFEQIIEPYEYTTDDAGLASAALIGTVLPTCSGIACGAHFARGYWFSLLLTVRPCKPLKVMYVRGGQTCFGGFWGKTSYRDVR
jgi:hypothetical protein